MTCAARTAMAISVTLHEAAVRRNGEAARQRQAAGHYAAPEQGAVIAVGKSTIRYCVCLCSNLYTTPGPFHKHRAAVSPTSLSSDCSRGVFLVQICQNSDQSFSAFRINPRHRAINSETQLTRGRNVYYDD